jgi:tetratricopeptide (TPR) repeat protein
MFSINIYLRFALIALFLGGGIILSFIISFWYSFPLILIGLVLLAGYLILGTVQSAAMMIQSMDFDKVEKRLALTLSPKILYSANRAYFYILKGTIAQHRNQPDEAELWLRKAEATKLPSDNERAMVQLQLANLAAMKDKWTQAKAIFQKVKEYKVTDANIKDQIKQFEKALGQQGQVKAARMMGKQGQMGGFRPGGKRRRPPVR